MKPVVVKKMSYPIFLWITTGKILFIAGDNVGKRVKQASARRGAPDKKPRLIMLLFPRVFRCAAAANTSGGRGYFLSNLQVAEWSLDF
nr:hypothetical protein [Mixta theicola]